MEVQINSISYKKEFAGKFGTMHVYDVEYSDTSTGVTKRGEYLSKSADQTTFKEGESYQVTEEEREYNNNIYYKIKPVRERPPGQSSYSKKLKSEQARYSSFAVAYCKDLIIADKLEVDQWEHASMKIAKAMLRIDKALEDDNS